MTLVLIGFGAYFLLRHRKNKVIENKKIEFQNQRKANKNVPDDECCIVCMECRRDVILLPCNHLILWRFCFEEIQEKCPHCSTKIEDHMILNFKNNE